MENVTLLKQIKLSSLHLCDFFSSLAFSFCTFLSSVLLYQLLLISSKLHVKNLSVLEIFLTLCFSSKLI